MILKKSIILLGIITLLSCSKKEKAIIVGKIKNLPSNEMSYLVDIRVSGNRTLDSTRIKSGGKFRYNINLKKTGIYQLALGDEYTLAFILSPGEHVEIQGDYNDFYLTKKISGSPNSERINILHDSLRKTITQLDLIRAAYSKIPDTLPDLSSQQQILNQQFITLKKNYHSYSIGFILEDLKSLTNILALYQEYAPNEPVFNETRDLQFYKLVSDSLTKYYPDLRHVKALQDYYSQLHSDYNQRRIMQTKSPISFDVPDLILPSVKGDLISLSSLKGKLVLLSFWSINQAESIQNAIELKKIYSKYKKEGFEIYQVSIDNSMEALRKRVAFEEISWISVIDTTFPDSKTRYLYNVIDVPMNYLINRDQSGILAKNISPEILEQSIQYISVNQE